MSVEGSSAPTGSSPPTCRRCARTPARPLSAANLRALLADSGVVASHRGPDCNRVQDAYSLRCSPQVHGAARDTVEHAATVAGASSPRRSTTR
jgi:histidine ammonia-lyase